MEHIKMEQDYWNDFMLPGDWSMTLPVDLLGGPLGDDKLDGCLSGNGPLGLHLQDAVEHVRSESPSGNEDFLGMEWMESSDLGSFLEVIGSSHDKLLPLEASLIEYTSSTAPEEIVTFDELDTNDDSKKGLRNSENYTLEHFLSASSNGQVSDVCRQDQLNLFLSLPSSPEQVAPVIKMETIKTDRDAPTDLRQYIQSTSLDFGDTFETNIVDHNIILSSLDLTPVDNSVDSFVTFDETVLISSPLSADDIDSMLSGSTPSSPSSLSQSSIIESSPELYKIISTSSVESTKRFSPYSRPKPSKQAKTTGRTHAPAELVPDYVIEEQLSKKDRKKLQNKNAAIRYRMKKKEEAAGIKTDEQILEERNQELRTKVDDLQREIKYMKNLMEDVCRAKGIKMS